MKISIIVPIYNTSKYLEKCINSLINQTYKNLEILLIDDGSTDTSLEICNSFATIDQRIKVFSLPNGGVANARNVGIKNSTGEYIGFVDSDDYIDKTMYEKLINSIIKNHTDCAACHYSLDTKGTIIPQNESSLEEAYCNKNFREFHQLYASNEKVMGSVCRCLFKKSTLNDLSFDISITFCEDLLFTLYTLHSKCSFSCVNEFLYFYRIETPSLFNHKYIHQSNLIKIIRTANLLSNFYNMVGLKECAKTIQFIFYLDIITLSCTKNSDINFNTLDKLSQQDIFSLGSKQNYKTYISNKISLKHRLTCFLAYHKFTLILKIIQKLKNITKKQGGYINE